MGAADPSPAPFLPPKPDALSRHFPHLEVLDLIGHGGMGAVYKARQTKLDRIVALKIVRLESASDPSFTERFNREARTLARLSHPNIVGVYDFGEFQLRDRHAAEPRSVVYFLMEYIDGANLRQLIESKELRPEQAMAIVPQICEALEFAHDHGVVHRDIKPENILLDQQGRVKIADFGLAKLTSTSDEDFTLTATHQVMGTPRYMAPEQMDGARTVDHRADIYSLGVVFYEMLTGEIPAGHFEPPSHKVQIDVRLDEIVLRSMAREPDRRYQRASEISAEVATISSGKPVAATPDVKGPFSWSDFGLSQVLLLPFLALLGFAMAWTGTSWPLLALALPWFIIPMAGVFSAGKVHESAVTATAIVCLLGSLGLIGYAVVLTSSAMSLLMVLVCVGAGIAGCGIAAAIDEESEGDQDKHGDDNEDEDEDEDDDEDEDEDEEEVAESPKAIVDSIASWLWFVSFVVCLLSLSRFYRLMDVLKGEVAADWDLLTLALAPCVLAGAQALKQVRSYPLAIATSILCLPLGLIIDSSFLALVPVGVGLWSLYKLSDADVRAYFRAAAQPPSIDEASDKPPKAPAAPAVSWSSRIGGWMLIAVAAALAVMSVPGLRHALVGMSAAEQLERDRAAWFEAAREGDVTRALELLDTTIDVNTVDRHDKTALMLAADEGHAPLAVVLLARGADPNLKDEYGWTAMMRAAASGKASVLKVFADVAAAAASGDAGQLASIPGVPDELVQNARWKGAFDYDAQDKNGETALMKAAASGSAEAMALVPGDAARQDAKGRTALMHAVAKKQIDLLTKIAEDRTNSLVRHVYVNGVENPEIPDHWYHPLFAPAALGARDADGKTALQRAADEKQEQIATLVRGEIQRAIDDLTTAIDSNPPQPSVYYAARAHVWRALGETEKADADEARAKNP